MDADNNSERVGGPPAGEPAEPESNHKDVFAHFGLAAYHAQCFEMEMGNFLIVIRRLTEKDITLTDLERFEEANRRKTMGSLLTEVRKVVAFEDSAEDAVNDALSKRNFLAHHFFREHAVDFMSHTGREKMIAELQEMSETFLIADTVAKSVSKAAAKVLGITDELVDQEFAKLCAQAGEGSGPVQKAQQAT